MIKKNLPVILLRGIVLLPNNDIRLEFDNDFSKNIIDVSEMFHDNELLVVSHKDYLEEVPSINDLPNIGIVSKITHKMELPNGKTRVVIEGIYRAQIFEYLNLNKSDEILESIIGIIEEEKINEDDENRFIKKLSHELKNYVKTIPYVSNSILATIENEKKLGTLTDALAPQLPIESSRLFDYILENNPVKRAEMILSDVYKDMEMYQMDKEIDTKLKKEIDNSQKEYVLREKIKLIKEELGDTTIKEEEEETLRNKIDNLKAPIKIKKRLYSELKRYEDMNPMSQEIGIIRNYIDWMLDLPWRKYTKDNHDLKLARERLDSSHYGLENVKTRIIEFLAVKEMTNSLRSPIICLVGPPGVGKTSLAFSIAKAINRKFVKVSVGGVRDEAEIVGHRRTYLGASPGRIIQAMKKAQVSNPVFLIDEIDKMTKDYKGDPASAILEILDPEQNKYFSDNYIEEEFDLSKVMFILTANYIEDIPEALSDRLEIVNLSGYTEYEKLDIAKKHLIPRICREHGLKNKKINISDDDILYIIRYYTREAGVRALERQLSTIVRKIVTNLVVNKPKFKNLNITRSDIFKFLGKEKYQFISKENSEVGVVNGLAYTTYGGDTLPVEVNYYKGNGNLVLTGLLGDVMKESARIALSYIKANYKYFGIDYNLLLENDIHIHFCEGAIPKDGPSAGIAITTALISALTNRKVDSTLALTGEISLRGNVLPIGGLKEKSIGANRKGIKTIIIPSDNVKDLDDVPDEVKKNITYLPVKNYKEVYEIIKSNRNIKRGGLHGRKKITSK